MSKRREFTAVEPRRPAKPPKPVILFQDDNIVVVNKPAEFWPREGAFDDPGVFDILPIAQDDAGAPPIQVTPLEYEVSGCVVYAFTDAVADSLRTQFADGRGAMRFDCVVQGPLLTTGGEIRAAVPPTGEAGEVVQRPGDDADDAVTHWRVLDTFIGFARIECIPRPADSSQVRFHLQHAGMPLAADARHGGAKQLMLSSFKAGYRRSRRHPERPLIQRPSLHAVSVSFDHPVSGAAMTFEAEFPKDYRALVHQLDRFGRLPA